MPRKDIEEGGAPPAGPGTFAGDIRPQDAWELLESDAQASLVDVRTEPEWRYVGIPDLRPIGKEPLLIEWQSYPGMAVSADFVATLKRALGRRRLGPSAPLIFICRSGGRSAAAARAAAAEGLGPTYNLEGGFEGDCDANHHRGVLNGWKVAGLPWAQS